MEQSTDRSSLREEVGSVQVVQLRIPPDLTPVAFRRRRQNFRPITVVFHGCYTTSALTHQATGSPHTEAACVHVRI